MTQWDDGDASTLLAAVRAHVQHELPGAEESTDKVSGIYVYDYGDSIPQLACMVARSGNCVLVGFYNVGGLPGGAGALQPWGSRHGYMEIRRGEQLLEPDLAALFAAARSRHLDPAGSASNVPGPGTSLSGSLRW